MIDLLITNGTVVSEGLMTAADVSIVGQEVQGLGKPGAFGREAKRIIDAQGCYVVPGAIDPHTHLYRESRGVPVPAVDVQSVAAAHGGTTTFIDFTNATTKVGLMDAVQARRGEIDGNTAVDYTLHACITEPSWSMIQEIGKVFESGISSFKIHLDARPGGSAADDGFILAVLQEVGKRQGIVGFHAENEALISYYTKRLLSEGKRGVEYFSQSRPNIAEAEPVRRLIYLSKWAKAAIYIFHISSREAVAAIAEAKAGGLPVYGEVCPHYLAFNDEVYSSDQAIQFIRIPPIKSAADQEALWRGVIDGTIDCIGTDHVTALLSAKKKMSEGKAFNELPGGMCQVENRLPFMYSEGYAKGRISLNRLVEIVSTNPAKIFGLYPKKGTISVGSDADIVLIDPRVKKKITFPELHMGVDYSIYEGWTFAGALVMTIAKGKVIVENGNFLGSTHDGEFLSRT